VALGLRKIVANYRDRASPDVTSVAQLGNAGRVGMWITRAAQGGKHKPRPPFTPEARYLSLTRSVVIRIAPFAHAQNDPKRERASVGCKNVICLTAESGMVLSVDGSPAY
jgi:hypothetical protein